MNQNFGGANRFEDDPPVQRLSTWPVQETGTRTENLRPTHQGTTRETNEVNLASVPFGIVLVISLITFTGGLVLGRYVVYGDVITESAVCKVEWKNANYSAEEARRAHKGLEQQLQNARQKGQEDSKNLAVCVERVGQREKEAENLKEQYQEEKGNVREYKTELRMLSIRYDEEKRAHNQHQIKLEVCGERLQSSGKDLREAKQESSELRSKLQECTQLERLQSSTISNLKEENLKLTSYVYELAARLQPPTEQLQNLIKRPEEANGNLSTRTDRVPPTKHKAKQCESKNQSAFNATKT